MQIATGNFEVTLVPQGGDAVLGRMTIDKQYHGDVSGTGKGEMLTAITEVQGSAGYVAIERVTGKVGLRSGSFVLQHSGTMNRGAQSLVISIVPDSGTDELKGIAGTLKIEIADGAHTYVLEYTLE